MRLVLTNAHLIDCLHPSPIPGGSMVVQDGRIVEVLHGHHSPAIQGDEVIDLQGSYVLPGLWDVHVHLEWPRLPTLTLAEQVVQYGFNARQGLLEAGVIGIRTAGVPHFIDVGMKRAFDAGQPVGPRVFAGGYFLTTTAGHALASEFAKACDGPNGFVKAIREQIQQGVDHIKLNLSGGIMGPSWDRHWHSFLLLEELEAAFTICRQRGYPVMAHAANPEAIKTALNLGAHTVEHGYIMDEECLQLFLDRGAWYIPTLGITHLTPSQATTVWEKRWLDERRLTPDLIERAETAVEEHRTWFRRALQAGVKMALGSDLRPLRDAVVLEMGLWVKDGATPWQTLLAATRYAAEVCGVDQELGTIEIGKLADLIVVQRNPLEDIQHLRTLELVFKAGQLVADHRKEGI